MSGDAEKATQDEIEELLRQAQLAAGVTAAPITSSAPLETSASPAGAQTAIGERPSPSPSRASASSAVGDDIQFLLSQAQQAIASVDAPVNSAPEGIQPFTFKDFAGAPPSGEKATLDLLKDVDLDVRIELGRTEMYLEDVLKLKRGAVVPLDKLAGDPVDIFVNGRLIARGEVLVLNDNFCVRVAELLIGDDSK